MKISLIGPSNIEKFSKIIEKPIKEIEKLGKELGKVLAENSEKLRVVFNYSGVLKLVGDSYKENNGKLEMLYTENDYDWEIKDYMDYLKEADVKTKKESWHDMLLSLVTDTDIVLCAGLSAGCYAELGYMKWNLQENKGVKKLIFIKELTEGKVPEELEYDLKKIIKHCSIEGLDKALRSG